MPGWDPTTFDATNDPADALYAQIRSLSAEVKSLNAQIATQQTQLDNITAVRDVKLTQLVALRDQIQVELTGITVPS